MIDAVAIAGHVHNLLHGDADAKARAAWELQSLMAPATPLGIEHTSWITRAGAIPLLVDLLPSGGDGARCAAGALANLACKNDDNQVAIAAAGGIAPLVEVVRSGCARAKNLAALALGNLAFKNVDNKVAIAAAGGIAPLIQVVRSSSAGAKASAANALQNLAWESDDNKVAIAAAGAVAPLVALMRSGDKGAHHAKVALNNLASGNANNQVLIAEAKGKIKKLVKLAQEASSDAAKDAAAQFLARRRRSLVRKCVDGKVPAELEPTIAACLARRGFS